MDLGNDPFGILLEITHAIPEFAFCVCELMHVFRFRIDGFRVDKEILHLRSECARIASHSAADGSRDATEFLPSTEALIGRPTDEVEEIASRIGFNHIAAEAELITHDMDDKPIKTFVGNEKVTPAAHDEK